MVFLADLSMSSGIDQPPLELTTNGSVDAVTLSSPAFKRHPLQPRPRREGICENGDRCEVGDGLALKRRVGAKSSRHRFSASTECLVRLFG
jgi:hypothetical protein